ncbi:hypothetical protein HPB50_011574 [Hyalomma asiaticum]|uniref:Uncharacterized protein n=1 Tax=Hyalomma asiaticum TaxID=266040 RepID=A0ACB7SDK2_HYAAI|nr:hypothetical protein HPB50_011574 [Hyalomma asiaticum]
MLNYGRPTDVSSFYYGVTLQEPNVTNLPLIQLNASDDRGIGIVRGEILSFASTKTIFNSGFKLIVLDEADAMTNDAQNALRRVIEKFTENARFCLICNYLSKIIPALQSRCTRFRFGPLTAAQMSPRIDHVITQEKLIVTADGKKALMDLAQGDMRKALNILQSTSMAFDEVNEINVYLCVGHPLKEDISDIVSTLLNEDFAFSYNLRDSMDDARYFIVGPEGTRKPNVDIFGLLLQLQPQLKTAFQAMQSQKSALPS